MSRVNKLYMKREGVDEPLAHIRPTHDWRVTIATKVTEMGFSAELADRLWGHLRPAIERTYNKHAFLNERREALEAWEKYVLALNKKKTPKDRKTARVRGMMEDRGAGWVEPPDPSDWKPGAWDSD